MKLVVWFNTAIFHPFTEESRKNSIKDLFTPTTVKVYCVNVHFHLNHFTLKFATGHLNDSVVKIQTILLLTRCFISEIFIFEPIIF